MLKEGMPYSSADWHVRAGSEEDFVEAWNAFIQWTVDEVPGARTFHLLRDANDPGHFVSFGSWDSMEAFQGWRQNGTFAERYQRCVDLCDEVRSGAFSLAAGMRAERPS